MQLSGTGPPNGGGSVGNHLLLLCNYFHSHCSFLSYFTFSIYKSRIRKACCTFVSSGLHRTSSRKWTGKHFCPYPQGLWR